MDGHVIVSNDFRDDDFSLPIEYASVWSSTTSTMNSAAYSSVQNDGASDFFYDRTSPFVETSTLSPSKSSSSMTFGNDLAKTLWKYVGPPIFVVGIIGNVLILVVMSRRHMRGTTTSVFLRWMAAADLCVLFTGMIPEMLEAGVRIVFKELHPVACKLEKFAFYTSGDTSIWICVAFTVDRFVAVCFPFERRRIRSCTVGTARMATVAAAFAAVAKNLHVLWTRGSEYKVDWLAAAATAVPLAAADGNGTVADSATSAVVGDMIRIEVLKSNCGRPTSEYKHFETYVRPWIAFALVSALPFAVIVFCNFFIVAAMIR